MALGLGGCSGGANFLTTESENNNLYDEMLSESSADRTHRKNLSLKGGEYITSIYNHNRSRKSSFGKGLSIGKISKHYKHSNSQETFRSNKSGE